MKRRHKLVDLIYIRDGPTKKAVQFVLSNDGIFYLPDITPPHIICPQSFVEYADAGYNSTLVSWIPPNSTDNTGLPVTIEQLSGPTSRSVLEAGPYTVQYNASDAAGNKASCHFSIVVNRKYTVLYKQHSLLFSELKE